MVNYTRCQTTTSDELDVSADQYWEALTDWFGLLERCPALGQAGIAKVVPAEGSTANKTPCTRIVHLNLPPEIPGPGSLVETLLHVDHVARTIHYCVEGEGTRGMRNYLATQIVDDLGDGRTRSTINARWDLADPEEAKPSKEGVIAIHHIIINGLAEAFIQKY